MNILLKKTPDLNIGDGTAEGQIAFWDGSKWVHTEITELKWNDTDKKLEIAELDIDNININGSTTTIKGDYHITTTTGDTPGDIYITSGGDNETVYIHKDLFLEQIFVSDRIYHRDDANTYMGFTTDQIDFYAGGLKMLTIDEGITDEVVVNQNQGNIDFRVEGDNLTNVLYTDANYDVMGHGGGLVHKQVSKTAAYTTTYQDHTIICTGTFNLTLAALGFNGFELFIKNISGTTTIYSTGNEKIEGAASYSLTAGNGIIIQNVKGVGWWIIAKT